MAIKTAGNATVSLTTSTGAVTADFARAKVTINATLIDTTDVGATYTELTPGFSTASGTVEAYFDNTTHGSLKSDLLAGTVLSSASVTCGGTGVSGKAFIESIEWDLAPNNVLMATIALRWANGALS